MPLQAANQFEKVNLNDLIFKEQQKLDDQLASDVYNIYTLKLMTSSFVMPGSSSGSPSTLEDMFGKYDKDTEFFVINEVDKPDMSTAIKMTDRMLTGGLQGKKYNVWKAKLNNSNYTPRASYVFTVSPDPIEVDDDSTETVSITVKKNGDNYSPDSTHFSTIDTDVFEVDPDTGVITPKAAGEGTLTIRINNAFSGPWINVPVVINET